MTNMTGCFPIDEHSTAFNGLDYMS